MSMSSFIKRYIFRLPLDKIFTSRDLLVYGSRGAVDQTTHKLVKIGAIIRLARGVFARPGESLVHISIAEVAKAKAKAFGKQLFTWGGNLAIELEINPGHEREYTYNVNTSSSSFQCKGVTVYFKKACPRKTRFDDRSQASTFLGALWHFGKSRLPEIQREYRWLPAKLNRTDKEELRLAFKLLPAWLSSCFLHWTIPRSALNN